MLGKKMLIFIINPRTNQLFKLCICIALILNVKKTVKSIRSVFIVVIVSEEPEG